MRHHHCRACAAACSSRNSSRNTGSTRNSNTPTRSSSGTTLAASCNSAVAGSTAKMSHHAARSDRVFQPTSSETNQRLEQLPWRRAQKCLVAAACLRTATPARKHCSSSSSSPSLHTRARPHARSAHGPSGMAWIAELTFRNSDIQVRHTATEVDLWADIVGIKWSRPSI